MKKIIKKILPFAIVASSSVVAIAAGCNYETNKTVKNLDYRYKSNDYDFGLVTNPLNNLNYIRYKSLDKVLPSLVIPFAKSGPTDSLKSIIQTGKFTSTRIELNQENTSNWDKLISANRDKMLENDGLGGYNGSFYSIDQFGILGGLGYNSNGSSDPDNPGTFLFVNPRSSDKYLGFTGKINPGLIQWSNGETITATDILDFFHYIFDLNTGSQRLAEYQKWGIRGAEEFLNAQIEYAQKYQKNYQNPFGLRNFIKDPNNPNDYIQDPNQTVWNSQAPGDEADVLRIKNAALKFGLYSGRMFLDHSNSEIEKSLELNPNFDYSKDVQDFVLKTKDGKQQTIKLVKNPYFSPDQIVDPKTLKPAIKTLPLDENNFNMIFDEFNTPGINSLVFRYMESIYPANRKYIETVGGGLSKYGSEPEKFLTAGPFTFDAKNIVLGPQGYIYLDKNNDYYDAKNTISDRIKIIFSTDNNLNAVFFDDNLVSQTYIPANKIISYWSNPKTKNFLNKNTGFGTIAYGFNLDNQSNAQSYVQDQDLRNAIFYAINRNDVLKTVGWDFSFPVTNWTAFQSYRTPDGKALELFYDGKTTKAKNGDEFPIQNYDLLVHLSRSFTFENVSRKDLSFSPKTAKYYLERFKKKYPNLKGITLTFLNNSSEEQKRAGTYLEEALKRNLDGFVNLDIKSLPENTFASFIEEGKYDIIYQNYDKLGGNAVQDYVATFFKPDETDKYIQKGIGFVQNPSGSYTYADWYTNMIIDALNELQTQQRFNSSLLVLPYYAKINELASTLDGYETIKNSENYFNKNQFINAHIDEIQSQLIQAFTQDKTTYQTLTNLVISYLQNKLQSLDKSQTNYAQLAANINSDIAKLQSYDPSEFLTKDFVQNGLQWSLTNDANIKESRIKRGLNEYLFNTLGVDTIYQLTEETKNRLLTKDLYWWKLIDLSFQRNNESVNDYSNRISAFFSGNLTDKELADGWASEHQYRIFDFMALMEKAVRDMSPVIPLMEVDTNWELTKIGGVSSLFKFDLQYAYDYTNPPRPGLPRNRGN